MVVGYHHLWKHPYRHLSLQHTPPSLRRDGENKERQDLHSHRSGPGAVQIRKVSSTNEAQDTWGWWLVVFKPSFFG